MNKPTETRRNVFALSFVVVTAILLAACSTPAATPAPVAEPTMPPATVAPTEAPAAEPTMEPTMEPTVAPTEEAAATTEPAAGAMGPATVKVADSSLGQILVDDKGMTLYMYTKDTNGGESTCYDRCAVAWPPLLTDGDPVAGEGADASLFSVTDRTDGTKQVSYAGWPLYYYEKDTKAGDVIGQDVGQVWYVLAPDGKVIGMEGSAAPAEPAAAAMTPTLSVADSSLGKILVGDKGMTLYMFTKDTNGGESTCYDNCAVAWPPLLVTGDPVAGEGIDASLLTVTDRTDGTKQVSYAGWPLYYYQKDTMAGDVIGQDVGQVWYVVAPDGKVIGMSEAAAPAEPAAAMTPTLSIAETSLGMVLVGENGLTLYMYTKDTQGGESTCYDRCAVAWPPLLTDGDPVAGEGVDASLLTVTDRTDGTKQVSYGGWPLYYYEKDTKAGDVTGQDVGQVWYVVNAAGEVVK